jgi:antitoxin component HigA of HigAB toxin-antitoxin module
MKRKFDHFAPGSNPRAGMTAPASPDLPDDLAALFATAPETTDADLAQLEKAAKALHSDPAFIAEHAKGLVVEDILRVMEKTGMSANALAGKIGKSRQYVSKILSGRANFFL